MKGKKKKQETMTVGLAAWYLCKGITYITMVFFALTFIFALIWILVNSLKTASDYMRNSFSLPKQFDFQNYVQVFTNLNYKGYGVLGMIGNTLILLAWNWFCTLVQPHLAAYVMARFNFKGRAFLEKACWVLTVVPLIGTAGMSMWVLNVTGLYDNFIGVFLLNSLGGLGMSTIMYMNIYKGIPAAYAEAAYMDGASEWVVFTRIYYPQALPVTYIFLITSFITIWGDFMTSYLYLPSHPTFALGLQQMQAQFVDFGNDYPVMFAALVVSLIPVLLVYGKFYPQIVENKALGVLK